VSHCGLLLIKYEMSVIKANGKTGVECQELERSVIYRFISVNDLHSEDVLYRKMSQK